MNKFLGKQILISLIRLLFAWIRFLPVSISYCQSSIPAGENSFVSVFWFRSDSCLLESYYLLPIGFLPVFYYLLPVRFALFAWYQNPFCLFSFWFWDQIDSVSVSVSEKTDFCFFFLPCFLCFILILRAKQIPVSALIAFSVYTDFIAGGFCFTRPATLLFYVSFLLHRCFFSA